MEPDPTGEPRSAPLVDAERLLADEGHDLGVVRARVAFGRSGIAIGFPRDPMIHVSWWAVLALVALVGIRFVYRRRAE